jgi:hypothetical protein
MIALKGRTNSSHGCNPWNRGCSHNSESATLKGSLARNAYRRHLGDPFRVLLGYYCSFFRGFHPRLLLGRPSRALTTRLV